jgi:hypothetical protein
MTVLFNIVPQAAIEAFQSQYQLPMTSHWGPNMRTNLSIRDKGERGRKRWWLIREESASVMIKRAFHHT